MCPRPSCWIAVFFSASKPAALVVDPGGARRTGSRARRSPLTTSTELPPRIERALVAAVRGLGEPDELVAGVDRRAEVRRNRFGDQRVAAAHVKALVGCAEDVELRRRVLEAEQVDEVQRDWTSVFAPYSML